MQNTNGPLDKTTDSRMATTTYQFRNSLVCGRKVQSHKRAAVGKCILDGGGREEQSGEFLYLTIAFSPKEESNCTLGFTKHIF